MNLLIALTAFAAPGGAHSWVCDPWSECKLETGLFVLEKGCKNLQICYQSKLHTGGTSKFGARFGLKKRVNEKAPFFDCAVVMGGEWTTPNGDLLNYNPMYVKFREIGVIRGDGFRAFSAFQFLPNTDDDVIVALKSEERNGRGIASYLFVYRLSDNKVLLDDEKIAPYKFEGLVVY